MPLPAPYTSTDRQLQSQHEAGQPQACSNITACTAVGEHLAQDPYALLDKAHAAQQDVLPILCNTPLLMPKGSDPLQLTLCQADRR